MLFFEHVIGLFLPRELGLLIAMFVAWLLGPVGALSAVAGRGAPIRFPHQVSQSRAARFKLAA
jgi:hypothetical protein